MALVLKDRVKETTTTTGTGTYTLAGAVAGFEAFSEIGNSNTTYYCCTDGTDFEVGIGTYTASGTTLARTTILQSSNSDNAVNWSSGSRTIFCTQPAEKAVFLDGSGNISIPGTIDGRDLATDGSKLDGIEASATADQTAAEIRTLVESATDSNVFTDADHTKLNGIEASADVTDTTNVTAAGALMDSEVTNLAQVKAFDSSDYATAAQGTTADAAMPKAGGTFTGDVTFTGANYNIVFDKSDDALEFADNAKAKFGSSGDLEVYHDGSNSFINDTGTGQLILRTTGDFVQVQTATDVMAKFIKDGAVELYHDNSKKLETTADGVTITSTDAGAGTEPLLVLYRDSASPADSDDLGQIIFRGVNDADQDVSYATIFAEATDVSDGTEDGQVKIQVMDGGSLNSHIRIGNDFTTFDSNVLITSGNVLFFEGSTTDAFEMQVTVTDPTADRTITLPDATGQVVLSGGAIDTDVSAEIGRAHIGNVGFSDYAGFSHVDQNGTTTYALLQHSGGSTYLNTTTGSSIFFRVANTDTMTMNSAGLHFNAGKVITFEGSTNDTNETTLTVTDPTADRTITLPDATGTVQLTDGSGASLTSLNASQLSSGTVPNARLDQQLQDVAGLAVTNGNFIVGDGSNFVAESGATARASLGLGTAATSATGDFATAAQGATADAAMPKAGGTFTGDVTLTDTDAGSEAGPLLTLRRNSSSPADNDILGRIEFKGENDADEIFEYATITAKLLDTTDGQEDGGLVFSVGQAGAVQTGRMTFQGYGDTVFSNKNVRLNTGVNLKFEGATSNAHETTLTVTDPTADRTITFPDATGTVQLTDGSGASLTSLNASQLSSGTVPNARLDQQLQDVAGLAVTNGNFIVGDGSNFVAESGSTARTSLGLGSIATQASNNVSITGGSVSGITDLAIADGGTGASSASAARTNLGLGTIATQAANSVNIDGGAIDAVTLGTNSAVTEAQIDHINIDDNIISSTDTNGHIKITPNGAGNLLVNADTIRVGDSNADATITTNGTGDLTLNTNSGTNSGAIAIADGANGNISITPNGTGSVIIDGLSYPQADGSNGQVLTTNGSGTLSFAAASGGISNDDATALAIALG